MAGWARRYRAALMRRLSAAVPSPRTAQRLGTQAAACGLEIADVARIHERAVLSLAASGGVKGARTREQARRFFLEALAPIERTHRAAHRAVAQTEELTKSLRARTRETTAAMRRLRHGTARRRTAESALQESERRHAELLGEAARLQEGLRKITHRILASQETERRKTGRRLNDDISQILRAIRGRLLALKKAAQSNTEVLRKEIAATQGIVKHSLRMVQRLALAPDGGRET